ncbi:glycoside hydrolase family 3 [Geoalkalibacter subterraneus]|uniref:Glycoside hydrolase family 3 n=1 Tax=Geoalkalibacter subterraneus TaxID=483547 RepID=A0A0B5FKY1_9BACT|nr:glycoside hydrolase family 3 [Geoalkalibacter subterraneus]
MRNNNPPRWLILILLCQVFWLGSLNPASGASITGKKVSLEARIGQMLMVGFRGMTVGPDHFIMRDIRRHNLGGVILFDYDVVEKQAVRNIESPRQVKALISSLQSASKTPLLIAVDQEGGRVARLKERYGSPPTLSHRELGQKDDLSETAHHSRQLAETLSGLGIGLNMAPVVDLCANPDNPVIAKLDRCFSSDSQKVTQHAAEFIKAHHRSGVLTTLKHFPGHGSSRADSHLGFTDVTDTWTADELEPYARIIAEGQADAVMTAHVFNARLDEDYPATLSQRTIEGILRKDLGFDGVVISDDMQMGAIADHYGLQAAIHKAIEAGVDILVFGNNLEYDEQIVAKATAIVRDLVHSGKLDEARIDKSYRRIMRLKERLTSSIEENLPQE